MDYSKIINDGLATGNQISDTDAAKSTTKEIFAEVRVPLLADLPAIQSLSVEGAFRRSDASAFQRVQTDRPSRDRTAPRASDHRA